MKHIPSLLEQLRRRPGMYIGSDSLPLLSAFLDGYIIANGEESEEISELLSDFQIWVQARYSISSAQNWSRIIQFFEVRESEAFERFFKLLDEYLAGDPAVPVVPADEDEPGEGR